MEHHGDSDCVDGCRALRNLSLDFLIRKGVEATGSREADAQRCAACQRCQRGQRRTRGKQKVLGSATDAAVLGPAKGTAVLCRLVMVVPSRCYPSS
jgi:hypothetical protein